jgi:hypothetical protein
MESLNMPHKLERSYNNNTVRYWTDIATKLLADHPCGSICITGFYETSFFAPLNDPSIFRYSYVLKVDDETHIVKTSNDVNKVYRVKQCFDESPFLD